MDYLYIILVLVAVFALAIFCGKFIAFGAYDTDDEAQRRADFHSGPGY